MDFESIRNNISTSNRFQVNRVDSVAAGHHSPAGIRRNSATLVGYKPYSRGSINTTLNMASMRDSIAPRKFGLNKSTKSFILLNFIIGYVPWHDDGIALLLTSILCNDEPLDEWPIKFKAHEISSYTGKIYW